MFITVGILQKYHPWNHIFELSKFQSSQTIMHERILKFQPEKKYKKYRNTKYKNEPDKTSLPENN